MLQFFKVLDMAKNERHKDWDMGKLFAHKSYNSRFGLSKSNNWHSIFAIVTKKYHSNIFMKLVLM